MGEDRDDRTDEVDLEPDEQRPDVDAVLEALAAGDIGLTEAKQRVRGVEHVEEFARVDARSGDRTGIPEVIEPDRQAPEETVAIVRQRLETAGRAIVTDPSPAIREEIEAIAADSAVYERSGTLVAHGPGHVPPEADGTVGVVTAGTSDIAIAERAAVIAEEMGCTVETVYDVGVSGLHRLLAERDTLAGCDCVVVAAGREGALATVVAGLVAAPVIGLPVGTGSGHGGDGEAALLGMLQSCTPMSVVNIDAGFVAGGQAALIARD